MIALPITPNQNMVILYIFCPSTQEMGIAAQIINKFFIHAITWLASTLLVWTVVAKVQKRDNNVEYIAKMIHDSQFRFS